MFRFHVLDDTTIPDPGYLPYYPQSFFTTIKNVHETNPLSVSTISIKDWVKVLTEANLTMQASDPKQFRPCRAELSSPSTDWAFSWKICRLQGLGSDLTTFNFKLLHKLFVTRERLHKLNPASSPICSLCSSENEDMLHVFFNCNFNHDVGKKLLHIVKNFIPNISEQTLLRLELAELPAELEFPLTFLTSSILMMIWDKRTSKSRISLYEIRATLEAKCNLLRKTRFKEQVTTLKKMLNRL